MTGKLVRIDVTRPQIGRLRDEVFCNQRLSQVQRRKAASRVVSLPRDGSRVDFFCEGEFVGSV
jgi:hypothetical protein